MLGYKNIIYIIIFLLFVSCKKDEEKTSNSDFLDPVVKNNGQVIVLKNENTVFKTIAAKKKALNSEYMAPATVVASILKPRLREAHTIILFDDEELNQLYTEYLQSVAHYKRDFDYLQRVKDMYAHKAATGTELKQAETGLTDAATEMAEKEGQLRMRGFDPITMTDIPPGNIWLISNVPENIIGSLENGKSCTVLFTSYPGERFYGKITAVGDVLDRQTRTAKVRITLANPGERFKPGMYAKVKFPIEEENSLSVPVSSVISVEGKNYVFVKNRSIIKRKEVITENEMGEDIILLDGIEEGDSIVYEGAMLLKGLSFGF